MKFCRVVLLSATVCLFAVVFTITIIIIFLNTIVLYSTNDMLPSPHTVKFCFFVFLLMNER